MSYTRDELVTEIRNTADAENDTRWNSTTVLRTLDVVFDREWARILAADPFYRVQTVQPTVTNGVIAKSDLTTGTGDAVRRFYRVVGVTSGDYRYGPANYDENLLEDTQRIGERYYVWAGDNLTLYPSPVNSDPVNVIVNHRPTLPSQLTDGSSTITFPEPYELILAYHTAAILLAKGGAETGATAELLALADGMRDDMLADLSRREIQPMRWRYSDARDEWAG